MAPTNIHSLTWRREVEAPCSPRSVPARLPLPVILAHLNVYIKYLYLIMPVFRAEQAILTPPTWTLSHRNDMLSSQLFVLRRTSN